VSNNNDLNLSDVEFISDEGLEHECDDELIVNTLLEHVMNGATHQMQTALELTKLVVGKWTSPDSALVFKTYQEALKTVSESSPIPSLLNMMGAELA